MIEHGLLRKLAPPCWLVFVGLAFGAPCESRAEGLQLAGEVDVMPEIAEPFTFAALDRIAEVQPEAASLLTPDLAPPQTSIGLGLDNGHELWLIGSPGRVVGKTLLRPDGALLLQTVATRDEVAVTLPSLDVVNLRTGEDKVRVTVDVTATAPRSQVTFLLGRDGSLTIDTEASLVHDVMRSDYGVFRSWRSSMMDPGWLSPTMGLMRVSAYSAASDNPCNQQWAATLEGLGREDPEAVSALAWAREAMSLLAEDASRRNSVLQAALSNLAPVDTHWMISTIGHVVDRAAQVLNLADHAEGSTGPAWAVDMATRDLPERLEEIITTSPRFGRTAAMVCQAWAAPDKARIQVAHGELPGLSQTAPDNQPQQPPQTPVMNRYPTVHDDPPEPWLWPYPRRVRVRYPWGWYWYWYWP